MTAIYLLLVIFTSWKFNWYIFLIVFILETIYLNMKPREEI